MIKLMELLNEISAADQAKKLGLDYMSFGRWGKDGKVTHRTEDDELVSIEGEDEPIEPLASLDYPGKSGHSRNIAHLDPRMPSLGKRVKARISPKRFIRHNLGLKAPKGLGYLTNPDKAMRNALYNFKTNKLI